MRTIPRSYPRPSSGGDYRTCCDYCGGTFHRSDLFRTDEGRLCCREEGCGDGRTAYTLDRLNAESASAPRRPRRLPGW